MATKKKAAAQPGIELRVKNIAKLKGWHTLGRYEGPGLYELRGRNAGGKTTLLNLLVRIGNEKVLAGAVPITLGELDAEIRLGVFQLSVEVRDANGLQSVRIDGADMFPPVELVPPMVERLINADFRKDNGARMRARLDALLTFCPIETSGTVLGDLFRCVNDRPAISADEVWQAWVSPEGDNAYKRSLIDAHDKLRERLQEMARKAEATLATAEGDVKRVEGAWREAGGTAVSLSGPEESVLRESLRQERADLAGLEVLAAEVDTVRKVLAAGVGSAEWLERATQAHAAADSTAALVSEARGVVKRNIGLATDDLRGEMAFSADDLRRAQKIVVAIQSTASSLEEELVAPTLDFAQRVRGLKDVLQDWMAKLDPTLADAVSRRNTLRTIDTKLAELHRQDVSGQDAERAAAAALQQAERDLAAAREADAARLAAVAKLESNSDVADRIKAKHERIEMLEVGIARAVAAARVRELAQELEAARIERNAMARRAESLRDAAEAAWGTLGEVVSASLSIPWIRLDTSSGKHRLLLRFNEDDRLAVVQGTHVSERDIEQAPMVSSAELHEAMLQIMVMRRESGRWLVMPWKTGEGSALAPLDPERRARFAQLVEAAGLTVIVEVPDEGDVRLVRTAAGAP